jgi:hypothetical protein
MLVVTTDDTPVTVAISVHNDSVTVAGVDVVSCYADRHLSSSFSQNVFEVPYGRNKIYRNRFHLS